MTKKNSSNITNIHEPLSIKNKGLSIPNAILIPLGQLIKLAIDKNLENSNIDLEENEIIFQKYNNNWFIIFKNSYFAIPEILIGNYDNKSEYNPYLNFLTQERAKTELSYKNETVKIYSTNISLSEILKQEGRKKSLNIINQGVIIMQNDEIQKINSINLPPVDMPIQETIQSLYIVSPRVTMPSKESNPLVVTIGNKPIGKYKKFSSKLKTTFPKSNKQSTVENIQPNERRKLEKE